MNLKRKTTPTKKPYSSPFKKQNASTAECKGETEECLEAAQAVEDENLVHTNEPAMHDFEESYNSEKLDSCEDVSDSDDSQEPEYCQYKKEDMCKNFKFRLGMKFASLQEFKDAVLEHSMLNGRQIKFVKNDATRVRVACMNCNFLALVSRAGRSNTFQMKTLVDEHTCGWVCDNRNAKPKWVAKVIVDKVRNNKKMKVDEIIEDVRLQYSVEIARSTAMRAIKIARDMVEGDAMKQLTLLGATQPGSPKRASQQSLTIDGRVSPMRNLSSATSDQGTQESVSNSRVPDTRHAQPRRRRQATSARKSGHPPQKQGSKRNTVTDQPSSQAFGVQEGQIIPVAQPESMTKQGSQTQSPQNSEVSHSLKRARDSKKSMDAEGSKGSKASVGSSATRPITRNMGFRSPKLPPGASGSTDDNPISLEM